MKTALKRILAIFLVALMAFGAGTAAGAQEKPTKTVALAPPSTGLTPEKAAAAIGITLGAVAAAPLTAAAPTMAFSFTPDTSGWYVFVSSENGNVDPYGYLYDEALTLLAENDDCDGYNFKVAFGLTAGKPYYLVAATYSGENPGNYQVLVRPAELKVVPALTRTQYCTVGPESFLDAGNDFPNDTLAITGGEALWEAGDAYDWYARLIHAGTATVTVTAPDGSSGTCVLTVEAAVLKVVPALTLYVGDLVYPGMLLDDCYFPDDMLTVTGGEALWEADDAYGWCARLAHAGTATITVTAQDGSSGVCALTVIARPSLHLPATFKMYYHETLEDTLLKDCGWPIYRLNVECDDAFFGWYEAIKCGATTVTITAPDGSSATVKITVQYSFIQWLCVVFLGGWYWMPFTYTGPFSLKNEIAHLQEELGMSPWQGILYFLFGIFAPAIVAGRALATPGPHSMHKLYAGSAPQKILILGNSFIASSGIGNALQNLLAYNERELAVDTVGIGYGEVEDFVWLAEDGRIALGEYDAVFVCGFYGKSAAKLSQLTDLAKGTDTRFVIFPAPNEQPADFAYAWVKNRQVDYLGWYDLVHYLWEKKGFEFEELAWPDMHSHSNKAAGYLAAMAVYTYLYGELPAHAADADLFELPSLWADLTQEQLFAKMQIMRRAVDDMVLKASARYYAETVIAWYRNVF